MNKMFSDMATRFTQAQEGAARMPILEAQVESLISERDALQKAKSEGDEHLANCETQLASLRTKVDGLTREKTGLSEEIKMLKEKQRTEETALSDRFQAQLTRLIGSIQQKDKEYSQLESMHNVKHLSFLHKILAKCRKFTLTHIILYTILPSQRNSSQI